MTSQWEDSQYSRQRSVCEYGRVFVVHKRWRSDVGNRRQIDAGGSTLLESTRSLWWIAGVLWTGSVQIGSSVDAGGQRGRPELRPTWSVAARQKRAAVFSAAYEEGCSRNNVDITPQDRRLTWNIFHCRTVLCCTMCCVRVCLCLCMWIISFNLRTFGPLSSHLFCRYDVIFNYILICVFEF